MSDDCPMPSGPWHGFYTYSRSSRRYFMDLGLDFKAGRIDGAGIDGIGRFLIRGSYEPETYRCYWFKEYIGKHDVLYNGAWDMGSIWGLWEIPPSARGGFRIWPGKRGEGQTLELYEEIPQVLWEEEAAGKRLLKVPSGSRQTRR
jgi:hypothetical protein